MIRDPRPAKIVLVDDHSIFAESLQIALEVDGYVCKRAPVASSATSAALLAWIIRAGPRVVLLDLDLGAVGDGARLIQPLTRAGIRVVVVTGSADQLHWGESIRHGARKVLSKVGSLEEILVTIRRVINDMPVMTQEERDQLLRTWHRAQTELRADRERLARLTATESAVLGELMRGHTVSEIAHGRFVSEATVRTQVKSVLAKLEVSSQIAAVGLAHRAGWRPPAQAPEAVVPGAGAGPNRDRLNG